MGDPGKVELIRGRVRDPYQILFLMSKEEESFNAPYHNYDLISFSFKAGKKRIIQYGRELFDLAENRSKIIALPVYPELREVLNYDYVVTDGERVAPALFDWIIVDSTEIIETKDKRLALALKLLSQFESHLRMMRSRPDA